nr:unnamed protein product [Callosobruchus analis]CAI5826234.1 unnamed protein product [Callosobruchus analis]CAI5826573.1 unnamed protein product [Callosobruchus analis]CAI5847367.1 unnamed protein product [Callosobruchus analis]CAI5848847.1 unnamed protein product [Callosobruchus analis]
MPINQGAY